MAATNVSSMFQFWKDFKLSDFQRELDTLASDLANRQDESDTSRKRLVEQSRDFKKNTHEEVRKAVSSLLKSFQSEVDYLSKRSKTAEASFLTIYKKLIDIPDPTPALEHGTNLQKRAQRAQDLEIENQKLRETLNEYNKEFAEVKNQEVTIKNLRDRLKDYEDKLETEAHSKALAKEKELQRHFAEKERILQEKQLNAVTKLGEIEQKNNLLQKALEDAQSELFDAKAKNDERSAAKSDEVEMLVTDLERANQRNVTVEKEVDNLRSQLHSASQSLHQAEQMQKAPNLEQAIDILSRSSLELELSAKEKEILQLVEEIQKLQTTNNKLRESTTDKVQKLEEKLGVKSTAFQKLEEKIHSQSDYDDLKRELTVMKSLEFASCTSEQEDDGTDGGKSLEMLLLEKNRALQTENTTLKVAKTDLNDRYEQLKQQNDGTLKTSQERKSLIVQLEQDLASVNSLSSIYRGEGEGQSTPSSEAEVIAEAVKETTAATLPLEQVSSPKTNPAESLLPIVSSQRERFRLRNQELEGENRQQQQQVLILRTEVDNLRSDNVKLYEKIKFLQSYPSSKPSLKTDDTESRYSRQYEARLDPFNSFSRKEKQRRYMNLSPFDKATLNVGRTILSNKLARLFALCYFMLLHMLVFLVLYKMAHTSVCKRDSISECFEKFQQHMHDFHPGDHGNILQNE